MKFIEITQLWFNRDKDQLEPIKGRRAINSSAIVSISCNPGQRGTTILMEGECITIDENYEQLLEKLK